MPQIPGDPVKNSIPALRFATTIEVKKSRGGPIDGEGAQRIVDYAARDGLTYAESRYLASLNKDTFTGRGKEVVDRFVARNPVSPPTDGAERVAKTQGAIDRAAANGKISAEEANDIRSTFDALEVTPETLSQQRAAVQQLLDRTDIRYEKAKPAAGDKAASLPESPSRFTTRQVLEQILADFRG
ncbi:MAG TPA: hypothetical protein VFB81_17340 [Myxococcales bacterium]|nr:hypothetical protein [Myxococcales bacterium]